MNGRLFLRLCGLLLALGVLSGAAQAANRLPEEGVIPSEAHANTPPSLRGFLFRPTGTGPFPAVVMLHGCAGPYTRDGHLHPRDQMWAETLTTQGYLALIVDSFSTRGLKELCTHAYANRALRIADRRQDAYAALRWLSGRTEVQADHVGVMGWSNGASTVLDVVSHPPSTGPRFRAALAFYPGCTAYHQRAASFHPDAPLLILMGDADDWTAAAPCKALTQIVEARGEPMQIVSYPETYHDFDNPAIQRPRVRQDVPNGIQPGAGVTLAPNPAAREDAQRRVAQFFAEHLK